MQDALLLFSLMFALFLAGIPIAFSLLLCGAIFLLATGLRPLIVVPQRVMAGLDSFPLLAIPLFILMGNLMEKAGLSRRLIDLIDMLVGRVHGALGYVTILACAMFGALTGSAPATVAAIGAIMMPAMIAQKYPPQLATGVTASAGALGNIIPPSIALILYGATVNVSIPKLFVANIVPGLLMALAFMATNFLLARRLRVPRQPARACTAGQAIRIVWRAVPPLLMPVVILGGIYGGVFTPTEAAAVGVALSLALGLCYRQFTPRNLWRVMVGSVETSSMVGFILGGAGIFGWILASARIPSLLATELAPVLDSQFLYLALLTVFLLLVGCIMDAGASIIILAPILVPIGLMLGVDPIHLGVVFCVNLVVGFFTPPFGLNLFTTVSVSRQPYEVVVRGVLPFVLAAIAVLFILAYVPGLSLALVRLMEN
ncbi:TRAP transporter, DctM subunit [Bordetella bronchiseptica CA90 BB1334]|uniref:TRAP transporter large permease n=1 Tax=Bordetella bronchiseptica TaxID=518 RepID=UPI00028A7B1F|nr:TRAP transporter large permease [Bordetella bronchiseptica]AZW29863.1 TRAP transporter large permease [Bordetella bronchiseptica]KCV44411.1 TRAP transporter, DctM subunit [Bordetella bronchiseptica 345]KDB71746.1 TRAP transporter, DctM subunit [Bordetella bronchiseptica CA90 BB1334]KDC37868.1 TRAP transporter, DctM subunit [Bordetella bronchiseptica GA96-01]KDD11354.1 TRAP transporter, DctM subunit [Bordetella bronchiseptica MBORD707]